MCFSATVSFGTSAVLAGIGNASYRKASTKAQRIFSMTPFFFAMQQFIEGCLWLALQRPENITWIFWTPILMNMFLFFAWMVWPIFIPYFVYRLEPNQGKKRALKVMSFTGGLVAATLIYIWGISEFTPVISGRHIVYERLNHLPGIFYFAIVYVLHLLGPLLISSFRKMKYLGLVNLLSFWVAYVIFSQAFISVWCFFAALSSGMIYYIILKMQVKKTKDYPSLSELGYNL